METTFFGGQTQKRSKTKGAIQMSEKQAKSERVFSFGMDTHHFIGRKAKAVYFGEERVEVKNWRGVYKLILSRCYAEYPDDLMYLRNKATGRVRTFLSDKPDGMVRPFQLAEELWADGGQYGIATLLHILRDCILRYTHFDCRDIKMVVQMEHMTEKPQNYVAYGNSSRLPLRKKDEREQRER